MRNSSPNSTRAGVVFRAIAAATLAVVTCQAAARPDEPARAPAPQDRKVGTFDEETGRDLANYPPHKRVDFVNMDLSIDIPDMDTPRLTARQRLTVRGIGRPVSSLSLNARLLGIEGVWMSGPGDAAGATRCPYEYDGRTLTLKIVPPLQAGEIRDIITTYAVNDPPEGLFWTLRSRPGSAAWPGRPSQIHTQGEPETNSYWFPCHDFPNDRLTTSLSVDAPAGYRVVSNGALVSHDEAEPGPGSTPEDIRRGPRERWRWVQSRPHTNYLVTMVVGKFDVVDVNTPAGAIARTAASTRVPMPVYVPPGRGGDVKRSYGRTAEMADLFARITGEPYPWDKYAQVVVWNFASGGMENTSATTMYDTAVLSEAGAADGDMDGLISHELAHQWFGDLLTCNSWEHLWLNEGFATYFSHLWFEQRDGKDAYLAGVRGNFDGAIGGDKPDAPFTPAMCSKEYSRPRDVFRKAANPYGKGAAILHMLRMRLGDEVFFRGLKEYVDRFKFRTVETSDLRQVLEEVSGESLEQFFAQWCERPGVPDLEIDTAWDSEAGEVVVSVVQKQNIDGYNPAFAFDVPVYIARGGGAGPGGATATVHVDSRETVARFPTGGEAPLFVAVDPDLNVLAAMKIKQPAAAWVAQLAHGPTYAARVQALRAPQNEDDDEARAAFIAIAASAKEGARLRVEAVQAMRERAGTSPVLALLRAGIEPVDVRSAALDALGDCAARIPADNLELRAECSEFLAAAAESDLSERCRAAAVRGIGKFKALGHQPVVLAAAGQESQNDRIRQAALDALADLDTPEALVVAIRCSGRGYFSRTRPDALGAVAKLGHHDPDAAFRAIAGLLTDRESRARQAAGRALVRLGDPRGVGELEYEASRARDDGEKRRYADLAAELRKKLAPPAPKPDAPTDGVSAK